MKILKITFLVVFFCSPCFAGVHMQQGDVAGGSLTGTYPNPTVSTTAVSGSFIINQATLQSGASFYVPIATISYLSASTETLTTLTVSTITVNAIVWSNGTQVSSPIIISYLPSTQTWTGQNNWTTPAPSSFTYGVVAGSITAPIIQSLNASGTNVAGTTLTINGGYSTGNALGGGIVMTLNYPGASGSSVNASSNIFVASSSNTSSASVDRIIDFLASQAETGTGGYTSFTFDTSDTAATGSGTKRLAEWRKNGTTQIAFSNLGALSMISADGSSSLSNTGLSFHVVGQAQIINNTASAGAFLKISGSSGSDAVIIFNTGNGNRFAMDSVGRFCVGKTTSNVSSYTNLDVLGAIQTSTGVYFGNGSNFVMFQASASGVTNSTYTWPAAYPSSPGYFQTSTSGAISISTALVTVSSYTSAGSFTWTKPSICNKVDVVVYGAGGGGGGGDGNAGILANDGGSGGGGGARRERIFNCSDLPASTSVVVGTGGAGGAATVSGSTGTASVFGSSIVFAGGGGPGLKGGETAGTLTSSGGSGAGTGGSGVIGVSNASNTGGLPQTTSNAAGVGGAGGGASNGGNGNMAEDGGGAGGGTITSQTAFNGGVSIAAGGGGGAGGGCLASNTSCFGGGTGGNAGGNSHDSQNGGGGTGGVVGVNSGAGAAGLSGSSLYGGQGGGGGAGLGGTGGVGGAGGLCGGAGGGGGSGSTGNTGGTGGNGCIYVFAY